MTDSPEATLMYGPDYARVIMGGAYQASGRKNFNPDNLNWFYTLFTPLSDCVITWGQQCFIVLGWGDDERFVALGDSQGTSFLPRATEPLTYAQMKLVDQAMALKKPCTVLCAHFTLANYAADRPFSERGTVDYSVPSARPGQYDFGTFESNRDFLYALLASNQIHYTLSGHSHRAGLYHIDSVAPSNLGKYGQVNQTLSVRATAPGKDSRTYPLPPAGKSAILVSPSSGPIPVQNINGELANLGLDTPAGSYIHFSGSKASEIGLKTASQAPQAKPRLAVVLDYADVMGQKKGKGVFTRFESATTGGPFTVEVNPDLKLKGDWIESISLYVVDGKAVTEHKMTKNSGDGKRYSIAASFSAMDISAYTDRERAFMFFMNVNISASQNTAFPTHYDTSKPWSVLVELNQNPSSGLAIARHSQWGEVPKHRLYSDINKDEYDYPWKDKDIKASNKRPD